MQDEELRQIRERFDAISRALARVSARVAELEARLAAPPPLPPVPDVPQPPREAAPPAQEQVPAAAAPPPSPPLPGVPQAPCEAAPLDAIAPQGAVESAESWFGLTWLNRLGVVTLVLGVAFLFKYAVDNEWIAPGGRVALGLLAGLAAMGAGEVLSRKGQRIFAMGITALGISLCYVAWYAAHGFYALMPAPAAFSAMAATTAAGAWLALRYNAPAIALLALTGGYATPLALSTGRDAPWVLFPYLLLLISGAVWAGRKRAWSAVEWLALAGGAFVFALWFANHFEAAKRAPAAFFVLCAWALFLFSASVRAREAAQLLACAGLACIFRPGPGPFFAAILPVTAAGPARGAAASAAAGFWIAFWIYAGPQNPGACFGQNFTGITAAFLILHGWVLWRLVSDRNGPRPADAAALAANGAVFYAAGHAWLQPQHEAWAGLFTIAAAAVFAAAAWILRAAPAAPVAGVMAAGFFTLAIPVQLGGWRVSAAWVLEAVALAVLARRSGRRLWDGVAGAVLALGLAHIALADARLETARLFLHPRFFAMAWAALGCWACAALLRPRGLAAASYVAGHAVLLAALLLDVLDQTTRTAAPEDVRSASIVGFSLVVAAYGVALVALGVARQTRMDRLLGLAALAFVVLKLYAYDVWQLGRLFRSAALVGLGLLLVAASYAYSRHRERMAKLLG